MSQIETKARNLTIEFASENVVSRVVKMAVKKKKVDNTFSERSFE